MPRDTDPTLSGAPRVPATDEKTWSDPEDTETRARRLRSAADTADFLIVHESSSLDDTDTAEPPDRDARVEILRERVDTGGYPIQPERVAEAMVRRVKKLRGES